MTRIRPSFILILLLSTPLAAAAQWMAYPDSSLRLKFTPREATVYVDGYFAGSVGDYDGTFERLRITPGHHEIVIYMPGHRSQRQKLYLSPDKTLTLTGTLAPLAAGEPEEPRPVPIAPQPVREPERDDERGTERRPAPPPPSGGRRTSEPAPPSAPTVYGTLSIRIQPVGGTVIVDGEAWTGPADSERLIVQVREGRHRVEVELDGYAPFVTEVEVRAGQTVPVNVSLARD